MIRNEGTSLRQVIVAAPISEYSKLDDLTVHNFTGRPDRDRAVEQHNYLRDLIASFDVEVVTVGELVGHPNSVFVRDVAVITPDGALTMRMGLPSRRGEEAWMENEFSRRLIRIAARVTGPATAEGGDVILAGDIAFVGHSSRTNDLGTDQVARILLHMGYRVRIAKVPPPYLHIGGAMSVIAPGRVVCTGGVFPKSYFDGFETIVVPPSDFGSGNVITVRPNEVIADASNEETIDILRNNNVIVHDVDLSEFVAGTGGPSCLILPTVRD
jgi:dimethylargininase